MPMPTKAQIEKYSTEKAIDEMAKYDSGFAIAAAIFELASANNSIAKQISNLGTGNAATPMGAIEFLACQIKESSQIIASAMSEISNAIERA